MRFRHRLFDELDLTVEEWQLIDLPAETGWAPIPPGLDTRMPGVVSAVLLSTVDVSRVSPKDRVTVLRARHRLASHVQAGYYTDLVSISDAVAVEEDDVELADEAAALEVRAALRLTRRTADLELELARDLNRRLPKVGAALGEGLIDLRRARVLAFGTAHLSQSDANAVVDEVIGDASRMTTGQLRARVRRACIGVDPEQAKSRYETAHQQRCLVPEPTVEGTVDAHLLGLAPDQAAEAFGRVDKLARSLCGPHETRSMDQLRADVAVDLLSGRGDYQRTGKGSVNIHVDLATLAELTEDPGEMAGYGPVIADIARRVTETQQHSEFQYTITNPDTGMVVTNGVTNKRRANTTQKRYVEARNLTCVFPGCRCPATQCDLDHTEPWEETQHTTVDELAPLCRHDHTLRHRHGWTYQQLEDGDYQWTSRFGHRYRTSGLPPPDPD